MLTGVSASPFYNLSFSQVAPRLRLNEGFAQPPGRVRFAWRPPTLRIRETYKKVEDVGLVVGLRKQSLGASPLWPGLPFSSPSSLTAQVVPVGKSGRATLGPLG